jgi:hypothetical protein
LAWNLICFVGISAVSPLLSNPFTSRVKNLFTAALLAGSFLLLGTSTVRAQSKAARIAAATAVQTPQTPEDAAREQQLRILEARAGNTSFGDGNGGAFKQYDKNSGGFTVRRFRAMPGQENKRGEGHLASGSNPKGQPLVHSRKQKKKFLFF